MNRQDFMNKLAAELSRLPKDEVRAAMEYYSEYFDEAGPEKEAEAITELGNPARIATQIKADYAVKQLDQKDGKKSAKKGLSAVIWVILGIFAAPVALPFAIALGAVALAIFITVLAVAFSLIVGFGATCIAGIALIVIGFAGLGGSFAAGLLLIGTGLVTTGIMALFCIGVILGAKGLIRLMVKWLRGIGEKRRMRKIAKEVA